MPIKMDDYKIGALGDLISGGKSPGRKSLTQKSPNKIAKGTPNSKQNDKTNGTPKGKNTPQKRKSEAHKKESPKKSKKNEDNDEEDESEEVDEKNDMMDEEMDFAKESDEDDDDDDEESDNEEEEDVGENPDAGEGNEDEADEEIENDDEDEDDSDDEAPEEQSSKPEKVEPKVKEFYHDRTIFVGNVKKGTLKKHILKHFKKYGKIESMRFRSIAVENPRLGKRVSIQKNKLHEGRTTCNAYVRFAEPESAMKAVEGENGKEFQGLHIRVTMSAPDSLKIDNKNTLFVGNLSFKAEDEILWQSFSPCGEIDSVRIVREKHTNVSKGFAYVNFKSADSVQLALQMGDVTIGNRVVRLSASEFAKKEKKVDPANECCVFVSGFTAGTSPQLVEKAFQDVGPVASVRLVKDKGTKKPSGCGFVTFMNAEAAAKALKAKVHVNDAVVFIQAPRTSFRGHKKNQADAAGKSQKQRHQEKGRISKPFKKHERKSVGGGSPPKSFQGSQGQAKFNQKKKVNRGELIKKNMAKKVAPK